MVPVCGPPLPSRLRIGDRRRPAGRALRLGRRPAGRLLAAKPPPVHHCKRHGGGPRNRFRVHVGMGVADRAHKESGRKQQYCRVTFTRPNHNPLAESIRPGAVARASTPPRNRGRSGFDSVSGRFPPPSFHPSRLARSRAAGNPSVSNGTLGGIGARQPGPKFRRAESPAAQASAYVLAGGHLRLRSASKRSPCRRRASPSAIRLRRWSVIPGVPGDFPPSYRLERRKTCLSKSGDRHRRAQWPWRISAPAERGEDEPAGGVAPRGSRTPMRSFVFAQEAQD